MTDVELEGGCRVVSPAGAGSEDGGEGGVQRVFGVASGTTDISLRFLHCAPGGTFDLDSGPSDDVWFVLAGTGRARLDGESFDLEPETGLYVAAHRELVLENTAAEPLRIASVRCPDPDSGASAGRAGGAPPPQADGSTTSPLARLRDQEIERTADRWYSVLVSRAQGCESITSFVGSIPPGRAPEHYHHYEEVIVILSGEGRMWAGPTHAAVEAGACVYLPREQPHCLENTGEGPLVLLGAFYPAGSPAVRYDT